MQPDTRARILDYLRKNPSATASELGRSLGMTDANVRHHLALLKKDGLIVTLGRRQEGRGRPVTVYGASHQVLGTGLQPLVEAMLDAWVDDDPDEKPRLRALAESLAKPDSMSSSTNPSRRLGQAVDRLNGLHYRARWEAGAKGARMILGHCPYAEIIERHPELCQLDAYLLEALSGLHSKQLAKLERGKDGSPRCMFALE